MIRSYSQTFLFTYLPFLKLIFHLGLIEIIFNYFNFTNPTQPPAPPHFYPLLLFSTACQHASITFKCHPGLHNNLIKTREKRLASLKPLFFCRSLRPDIPPTPLSLGLDVDVGGLYCSLVKKLPFYPPPFEVRRSVVFSCDYKPTKLKPVGCNRKRVIQYLWLVVRQC